MKVLPLVLIIQSQKECDVKYITISLPHGLRRGSAAARLLELRVRIPPRAWMSVSCGGFVLSGRGLYFGLITPPEQSC
jgi:hypothetical protein